MKNVQEYIKALEHLTQFLKEILAQENIIVPAPTTDDEKIQEITDLRFLARSNLWPDAIDPALISDPTNEKEKLLRAEGVIHDFMKIDLTDKTFLEIGCGEGHTTFLSSSMTKTSVGYDAKDQNWDHFEKRDNLFFTTNEIPGTFEVILLNDVLDHTENPLALLELAKKHSCGEIYVRCHPWTSRHGTHLFRQLNKAYLQLVFTKQELFNLGLFEEKVSVLLDPIETYKEWFAETGLKIVREEKITQDVELFFTQNPVVLRRIKEKFVDSSNSEIAMGKKFPRDIIQVQFADFVLTP